MSGAYRILITGSRSWTDVQTVRFALESASLDAAGRRVTVVHGACPAGADFIVDEVAREFGFTPEPHPADWKQFGKAAGFRRNAEMVALGADTCLAFAMPCTDRRCTRPRPHDSHGTAHCAGLAEKAGIPVTRVVTWVRT